MLIVCLVCVNPRFIHFCKKLLKLKITIWRNFESVMNNIHNFAEVKN